jgi:hypothetical protein|tara:strand:- start:518 stop:922 length:405 start_codon:yes stop_codon:yes gene_type:complete
MSTNWREFGSSLSDKLINTTFASARLACEIDQLSITENDWSTGGSSVAQAFAGFAIRTKLDKTQYSDTKAELAEFELKIKASTVPFEISVDNQVMRLEKKSATNHASLGMFDAEMLYSSPDAVDAVYTVLGRFK